jgi:protein-disulfide isomerase
MSDGHSHGDAKMPFFLGFFAGISLSSVIALILVACFFLTGRTIGAGATGPAPSVPSAYEDPSGAQPSAPRAPLVAVDESKDHIIGAKNAKVTLVEYSDFECPFCKRHESTLREILKAYPNDVRLVYRHYPLSFHPEAMPAAVGSECAAELGGNDAFWKFHARVMDATVMNADLYKQIAKDLKLDEKKFAECTASGKYDAKIAQQTQEGAASGVEGTPGTFVNGQLVEGAVPLASFKAVVDQALKQ